MGRGGMFGRFRGRRSSLQDNAVTTPEGSLPKRRGAQILPRRSKSNNNSFTSPDGTSATEVSTASNNNKETLNENEYSARKRQLRRNSFGDGSISTTASVSDTSTGNGNQKTRSSSFAKNRRSRRQSSQEVLEEEKKEIPSEAEEEQDEFFKSPEFRNKVAHEAADLDKEGNSFFEKGDYDQAFLSYERALKLKRATLQVDRKPGTYDMLNETESQKASILASVATSINNMTYLRQRAGQATADETMAAYLKSLQIKREILGPNHLSVGKTLNNIGSVFYLKKEFVPALKAYENAYEIMAEQLGESHLDVGTVLSNIGDVHTAMSDKPKALDFYKKALDIRWAQLGRNDPKVVRLMEQTASLETGKQPRRKESDSDSEDEEFAREDRERRRVFQQECHALQEELVEDIKFFDLVERTLAIELVQQKTNFMRAVRSTRKAEEASIVQSDSSYIDHNYDINETDEQFDDDSFISVMSAPPDLDLDGISTGESPEVMAFLHEIGADKSPSKKTKKHRRNESAGRPVTPTVSKLHHVPSTPPTASTVATSLSPVDDSIDEGMSPGSFSSRLHQRRFPVHPRHSSKPTAFLTPEERKMALITVQERLATLKSKRELEIEENEALKAHYRSKKENQRLSRTTISH